MTAIDRHSITRHFRLWADRITRPLRAWADRNTSRIVWGIGFAWLCFFWGMVLAYAAAPGIRVLFDAVTAHNERPAICEGLSAGECGEAMEAR